MSTFSTVMTTDSIIQPVIVVTNEKNRVVAFRKDMSSTKAYPARRTIRLEGLFLANQKAHSNQCVLECSFKPGKPEM